MTARNARVPETVVLLLFVGSALSLGMLGYSAGLTYRQSALLVYHWLRIVGSEPPTEGGSITT